MQNSVRSVRLGWVTLKLRQTPEFRQVRFETGVRRTTVSLILASVDSRVPEHRHPHWEVFWFSQPAQVTIDGGSHRTKWMVTLPNQRHSIEAPCRVVALKVGPR